ncbi:MAG: PilZ domain-containing protein [Pyrinomonadaceae bacterium]
MQERRNGDRLSISFPIRLEWKNENGEPISEEGLTENVGRQGALIHLPRKLPAVGGKVNLTVTENAANEVTVTAQVLRLERNAAHPQVALMLLSGTRNWEKHVWKYAGAILAAQKPDDYEDWN